MARSSRAGPPAQAPVPAAAAPEAAPVVPPANPVPVPPAPVPPVIPAPVAPPAPVPPAPVVAPPAMTPEIAGMHQLLTVCGLSEPQRNAFINIGGVDSTTKMAIMKEKHIDTLIKNLTSQGTFIGYQACNLAALAWWLRDCIRRDIFIDVNDFNQDELDDALTQMEHEKEKDDMESLAPGKIKTGRGWPQWELSFENYLRNIKGKAGVPLLYIIRKDDPNYVPSGRTEQLIYQAPQNGIVYDLDNQRVFSLIKNFALDTQAWEWIRTLNVSQDGRLAMQTLRDHYDGPGEVQKRLALARQQIRDLHYRSEQTFTFENFATKLKGAFEVLEECKQPITDNEKVSILSEKIQVSHPRIQSAITIVTTRDDLRDNFEAACNMISEIVAMVFPDVRSGKQSGRRNVSAVNQNGGRGGRGGGRSGGRGGGGRGRGAGGHGGQGQFKASPVAHYDLPKQSNGVDLSDIRRQMPQAEWTKLDKDLQRKIREHRAYLNANGNSNQKRKVGALDSNHTDEQDDQMDVHSNKRSNTTNANPKFGKSSYKGGDN